MTTWCVLVAAGSGTRLGQGPKAFLTIGSRSVLAWAILGMQAAGVHHLVVVGPAADDGTVQLPDDVAPLAASGRLLATTGGASRQASVQRGLSLVPADATVILVHDAARCFTPMTAIRRVVEAVHDGAKAVIPGLSVTDTLRWSDGTGGAAPERARLVGVQTPQGFDAATLRQAHQAGEGAEATDDAVLAERLGAHVVVVEGDELSFKVTRPLDLVLADSLVARGEEEMVAAIRGDGRLETVRLRR